MGSEQGAKISNRSIVIPYSQRVIHLISTDADDVSKIKGVTYLDMVS